MKATIAWWDLDRSDQTIDSLRAYLREEGVRPWAGIHGLRLKFWISDRLTNRWGAVMLWESTADLEAPMPPHRAVELIGYPPTHRMAADVEATVEGIHAGQALVDLGLAFEPAGHRQGAVVNPSPLKPVPTEFDAPPADPMSLFRAWFDGAVEQGVREPGALALATADARGRASNRIVQVIGVRTAGLVFTSHAGSRKGRDLAATGWASGVLYWRETGRQVIVTGPVDPLPDAESEALWAARPVNTHPMSVASHQSAPLHDENALREQALRLTRAGLPLARPAAWLGYLLAPESVEFWQASPDRLHRRLRYERSDHGWATDRLQP